MDKIDKSRYPQMPRSFHNRIEQTFESLEQEKISVFNKNRSVKTIMMAAVIIVLLTVSAFAGEKVYKNWIEKNNYQVTIVPEQTMVTKEYVSIKFNYLPQGLMRSDEYHYSFNNDFKGGLSLSLYRLDEYGEIDIKYSVGYEEKTFGQNKGAIITKPEDYNFNRELIIYFENDGYMLRAYVGKDVSDEELMKIAEGTELVETDKDHAFRCEGKPEKPSTLYQSDMLKTQFTQNEVRHIGDTVTGLNAWNAKKQSKSEHSIDVVVESVDFYDNISKFNKNDFHNKYISLKEPVEDENGNLLSYERKNIKYGDGVNSINEVESVDTVNNRFMCITLTLKNTSDANCDFYVSDIRAIIVTESEGVLSEKMLDFCSGKFYNEMIYVSPLDSKTFTNRKEIKANSSVKVTVGYFVDEDRINDIYLTAGEGNTRQIISIR